MIFFLLFVSIKSAESVKAEINNKGTLVESQYYAWENSEVYSINNIFDDDDTNILHSSKEKPIGDSNPFIILVDMGEIINADMLTLYGSLDNKYQYQPKDFILYGGIDKDNLEVFANVKNAKVDNKNVEISFGAKSFRYYKLYVTKTYASSNNYISYRYAKFSFALPMATPNPERTPYPGSNLTFVNKEFTGTVHTDQIPAGTMGMRQISGCHFTNIHDTTRNYYIRIAGETQIFDNIFENTEIITGADKAGIIWNDYTGKLTVSNCKFIRISGKGGEGYVFTSAAARTIHVTFDKCDFVDCGKNGNYQLISLLGVGNTIKITECKFLFSTKTRVCGVLTQRTNDCLFDRCEFVGCAANTILLSNGAVNNEQKAGTFVFTNNKVKYNLGKFIRATQLLTKPVIDNNVFESTTLNGGYFIELPNNQELIELSGNTFSQITSSGTQDKSSGGAGIFIESSLSEFTIRYNNCKFIDITNNQGTYPNCLGGAIQYGFSDNSNLNCHLKFTSCEFKGNKVQRHGGAVAIRTSKSVTIQNCKFETNNANNANTNSELLFSNHYSDKSNGLGGGLYLNPTFNLNGNDYQMSSISISGSTFKNNRAYQGYAIYLEGEDSSTTISISGNTFDGNSASEGAPNNGGVISSEMSSVDRNGTINSNRFTNLGQSIIFSFADRAGNSIPVPKPTQFPGTVDTYINKVFSGSVGIDQVQAGENNINQISGCRFTNIHDTSRNYYFKINAETIIFDNIFENTEIITAQEKGGVFWNNYSGHITLSNCTFTRISGKGGEGYVFTSNGGCHTHVTFDRCDFVDCGKNGDLQLISLLSQQSSIKLTECKFTFTTTSRVCGVLDLRTNDCLFDHCEFTGCAADTILLSRRAESSEQPIGTFVFTNNKVKNNLGTFIKSVRLLTKPVIDNNVFESTTLNGGYFIELPNNQELIELNGNTFSQITSSGTQDKSSGGAGIFIESSLSEFTIRYNNCKFLDITNNQGTYPNCLGGAIQYGFSDSSNLNCHLKFTSCEFKGNKVQRHGGAVAIRTSKSVTIQNCKFETNIANNINTNSELLFSNHYSDKSHGFGGGLYLNPTFNLNGNDYQMSSISISGCIFKNNRAYQGYAIYLEGEDSSTTISFTVNTFDGNSASEGAPNNGVIICSEMANIDKESILNSNAFSNYGQSEIFSFADRAGNSIPVPKPTQFPGTVDTYINKVFTGSAFGDQIQAGENNINQISGSRFTDIHLAKNYYIKVNRETIIFDNVFENTQLVTGSEPGIFWNNYSGNITLSNCTFTRISGKGGEGYVFTSNGGCHTHVTFDRCDFVDCGKNGDLQLISLLSQQSSIKLTECKFTFTTTSRVCGVLDLRTNDCLFDHCEFTGCAADTILLSRRAESSEQPIGTFVFTNNKVKNNLGTFIKSVRLLTKPVIDNNVFESTTLNGGYFIELPNNQELIELNGNTFSQITSSGTQDKSSGGAGIFIESSLSEFTIRYNNCKFIDITNNQGTYPNCLGGAIQYGFSDSSNLNCHLKFTSCEFKGNKVQRHGGAVAIRTSKSVTIQNCKFETNIANNGNANSELLFSNHYDDKSHGFGGGLYLNPTFNLNGNDYQMSSISISGCTFKNNRAYQGYAIYLEGEDSSTTISISGNTFDGNSASKGASNNGGVISSEITSLNDEDIINSNKFSNLGQSEQIKYVGQNGNPLVPKPTNYPGSVDTYIDKVFTGSVKIAQIQAGVDGIKQISGCRFTNIHDTTKNYYIRIGGETIIFNNTFENTQLIPEGDANAKAGIIWNDHAGSLTVSNCKFIRISGKGGEGYVFTSAGQHKIDVIFDQCDFIDCGKNGNYQLISLLGNERKTIKLTECKFIFTTTTRVCGVLTNRKNDCVIDRCEFTGCAANTILLSNGAGNNEQTPGTFVFTNNKVKNNLGKFIRATRLLTKPVIDNNVFESTTLNGGYFIELPNNQELIELNGNTFSQITSSGTQDKSSGGAGIFIESSLSEFTIRYNNCKFIDITNNQGTYPNCLGGAIQYGFSDSSNLNCHLKFTSCEFKGNKVQRHGGAVAIRTSKSVTIQNCKFETNIANNVNTNSELLFSNHNDEKTNGFGGSIYINPTFNLNGKDYQMSLIDIDGCTFTNNQAYQGYAIYIEGEECDTSISVSSNTFASNMNTPDSTIEGSVVCSEIQTVSKRTILTANTFVGADTENTAGSFNFVNQEGEPIPDYEQPPDLVTIDIFNATSDGRYVIDEEMKQTVLVLINISNFTDISYNNGDGGAIRIIDAGIECHRTTFTRCSSSKAGGAIYLSNSYEYLNSMTLDGLYFNENRAQYGGALYIYSYSKLNLVSLTNCNFVNNEATAQEAPNTKYGGSAVFITARNSTIMNNHFSDNKGPGPVFRIYSKFEKKTLSILPKKYNNIDGHITISGCLFEIGKESKSFLFYDHGIDDTSIELVDCKFTGELAPGSHYIDGVASINNNSPKFAVKGCKFASDSKDAFNFDLNNKLMKIDLKDQVFSSQSSETMKKRKFDSWEIGVAVAVPAVVILVVALIINIMKKKNQNDQQLEINEAASNATNDAILI